MSCSRGALRTGAPARHHVGIARRIDYALRQERLASRLALRDHTANRAALQHGRDAQPVQKGGDSRFLDQNVRDVLEHLRIERVAQGLRLRRCRSHGLRPLLELDADALAINGPLVPIPGEPLDADLSDVATEATIALEQGRAGARACRRERGG